MQSKVELESSNKESGKNKNRKIFRSIAKDYGNNSKKSFIILLLYRLMNYCYVRKLRVLLVLLNIIKYIAYALLNVDAQISYEASIGDDIRLPHSAGGVVISSYAIIGDHITIYHQVTIGINEKKPRGDWKVIVNDNCYLSAGCKVISCEVGEGSKIGPNAVCYKDIPPYSVFVSTGEIIKSGIH